MAWGGQPEKSEEDENCARLFGQIIGCASIESPDFKKIKNDIEKLHITAIRQLILMRYDAVAAYFDGDLKTCLKELEKCIDLCNKNKDIPKWLMNDVAIDLRNMQIEIDRGNEIIRADMHGQNILNQDNEPFEMIDEEPYQNKVGMLSRLEKEDLEDPKIKYIFDKGKSDAHYWVRMTAERPFIESM